MVSVLNTSELSDVGNLSLAETIHNPHHHNHNHQQQQQNQNNKIGDNILTPSSSADDLCIQSTNLARYCIYVFTKKRMRAFVLQFDYHYRIAVISRRGKQLRIIPFTHLLEPLLCPFDPTFLTIRTTEPNSYSVYAASKLERNELNTIMMDILKGPSICKCPSVDIMLYAGYIQKKGKVKWSNRWVEIQQLQIFCYKKRTSNLPVNVIPITDLTVKTTEPNMIILKNDVRVFYFRTETEYQRDTIYNKLVSIGVPNKNHSLIKDYRKKSLKLIPAVNLISGYTPISFLALHSLLKEPGKDLKQIHFENSAITGNSHHHSPYYTLQQQQKQDPYSFATIFNPNNITVPKQIINHHIKLQHQQPKYNSLQMEPNDHSNQKLFQTASLPNGASSVDIENHHKPPLARRQSVKQLIDRYNSIDSTGTNSAGPSTTTSSASTNVHQRKSFTISPNTSSLNLMPNNNNNTTQQSKLNTTGNSNNTTPVNTTPTITGSNNNTFSVRFTNVNLDSKDNTHQSPSSSSMKINCIASSSSSQTNVYNTTQPTIINTQQCNINQNKQQTVQQQQQQYSELIYRMDLLNSSCDEILTWIEKNRNELTKDTCQYLIDEFNHLSRSMPNIQQFGSKSNEFTYVFDNVQIQYTDTNNNNNDNDNNPLSSSTNSSLVRSNSICSSYTEDLSSDSEEEEQIFMAESHTSIPITFNLSPFPKIRHIHHGKAHSLEDITSNVFTQKGISS